MYNGRSCHLTASGPYDLLPADQPNAACMCAFEVPSSAFELRWTPRMVADVEAAVVRLLLIVAADLAPAVVPALACNIFQ